MPQWIAIPDGTLTGRVHVDRRGDATDRRPLILLGGMTQTLASWGGHLRPLAETRQVIAYEARGQGTTELDLADCSLAHHVEDFAALHSALGLTGPVDLCGFSFGGRLALTIAARRPDLVDTLVCSGVALDRGIVGRLIVRGWLAALATGDLEALARVSLPEILGPAWLTANAALLESVIRATIERNRYEGVLALMRATAELPPDSDWQLAALAPRVRARALCMVGELDRLAPPAEVAALAEMLGAELHIEPDVGHTIAIEAPTGWRTRLLEFLDRT